MRKLTEAERREFIEWANESIRMSNIVGNIFRAFGGFQIGGIFLGILFGGICGIDILFAIVGAGILAAFYFGIPALIISQNIYKKMAKIVKDGKEIVYDGNLTGFARNQNSNSSTKGKVFCQFDEDCKLCNIPYSLINNKNIGIPVAILSFNIAATGELFAIQADESALEQEE